MPVADIDSFLDQYLAGQDQGEDEITAFLDQYMAQERGLPNEAAQYQKSEPTPPAGQSVDMAGRAAVAPQADLVTTPARGLAMSAAAGATQLAGGAVRLGEEAYSRTGGSLERVVSGYPQTMQQLEALQQKTLAEAPESKIIVLPKNGSALPKRSDVERLSGSKILPKMETEFGAKLDVLASDIAATADDIRMRSAELSKNSKYPEWMRKAFSSAAESLTVAAGSAVLGGLPAMIGAFGAQTYGQSYEQAKQAGLNKNDRSIYAAKQAAIEVGVTSFLSKIGLGGLEAKGFGEILKNGVRQGLKQLGYRTIAEVPEELIIQFSQNLVAAADNVDPEAAGGKRQLQDALDVTLATVATMGMAEIPGAITGAARRLAKKEQSQGIQIDVDGNDFQMPPRSASRKDIAEALNVPESKLPDNLRTQEQREQAQKDAWAKIEEQMADIAARETRLANVSQQGGETVGEGKITETGGLSAEQRIAPGQEPERGAAPGIAQRTGEGAQTVERRQAFSARQMIDDLMSGDMPREEAVKRIETELYRDPLTGAFNRAKFDVDSQNASVFGAIDADGLKYINDTFGHATGDLLLKNISQSLEASGLPVYRLGGDEFFILHNDMQMVQNGLKQAEQTGLLTTLEVEKGGEKFAIEARFSSGVGETAVAADEALYQAKLEREARGERAGRGEAPPGISRIDTEGGASASSGAGGRRPLGGSQLADSINSAIRDHVKTGAARPEMGQGPQIELKRVPPPEILEIAQNLMGAMNVRVKDRLSSVWGHFQLSPKPENIGINPAAAATSEWQLAATLAHELGHAVDYLPEKTMQRGNIFGRIASLINFGKRTMSADPNGPGPLTDADRQRLRRLAERLARKEAESWVDEEITQETPITPDDVLAIWNMASESVRETNPALYQYIARLSAAEKKSIIKEVLANRVPEELQQFRGIKTIKTGKKIRVTVDGKTLNEAIREKYEKFIVDEMAKRRLYRLEEISGELKTLTQWWKPFNESTSAPWYVRYRYSSPELYADAMSVLFNAPAELASRAPKFFEMLWNYRDAKQSFAEQYDQIQALLQKGTTEVTQRRRNKIYEGYQEARESVDQQIEQEQNESAGFLSSLYRALFGGEESIRRHTIKKTGMERLLDPVRQAAAEATYKDAEMTMLMSRVKEKVADPLRQLKITHDQVGEYMEMRRNIGQRASKINPGAFTPTVSAEQMQSLRRTMGDDRFLAMERILENFYQLVFEEADAGIKDGIYNPNLRDMLLENRWNYAAYIPIKHVRRNAPASVRNIIGTFDRIENPFEATIKKMLAMQTWRAYNRARRGFVAEMMKNGAAQKKPKGKAAANRGFVQVMENGRRMRYEAPKDAIEYIESMGAKDANRAVQVYDKAMQFFHQMFVGVNPKFAVANVPRDVARSFINMPSKIHEVPIDTARLMFNYLTGLKAAWRYAHGNLDPITKEMLANKAVAKGWIKEGSFGELGTVEALAKRAGVSQEAHEASAAMRKAHQSVTLLQDLIATTEILSKIAGFKTLRQKGFSAHEAGQYTREYLGTPDYRRKGSASNWANRIYMYSNVFLQGLNADARLATNPTTAAGWWLKSSLLFFLPKLMMMAAQSGMFDDEDEDDPLSKKMKSISRYDKRRYLVLPLWRDEEGYVTYLRLPQSETQRYFTSAMWTMTQEPSWTNMMSAAFDATYGETPGLAPPLKSTSIWAQYLAGRNPVDDFRGAPILSRDADKMRATGRPGAWEPSRDEMIKWQSAQFGVGSEVARAIYSLFQDKPVEPDAGIALSRHIENAVGLGGILKRSKRGDNEDRWADVEVEEADTAYFRQNFIAENVQDMVRQHYFYRRLGVEHLTEDERREAVILKRFYNAVYLPNRQAAGKAFEAGDDERARRIMLRAERAAERYMDKMEEF